VKLNSVDHIGIVVKDMDAAVESWSTLFGLGPWANWEFPGSVKGTMARLDGVGIQFIEPLTETAYHADFLRTTGGGVHHFCVLVDDVDAATKEAEAAGGKVTLLLPGIESNVQMDDTGVLLEFRKDPA